MNYASYIYNTFLSLALQDVNAAAADARFQHWCAFHWPIRRAHPSGLTLLSLYNNRWIYDIWEKWKRSMYKIDVQRFSDVCIVVYTHARAVTWYVRFLPSRRKIIAGFGKVKPFCLIIPMPYIYVSPFLMPREYIYHKLSHFARLIHIYFLDFLAADTFPAAARTRALYSSTANSRFSFCTRDFLNNYTKVYISM